MWAIQFSALNKSADLLPVNVGQRDVEVHHCCCLGPLLQKRLVVVNGEWRGQTKFNN